MVISGLAVQTRSNVNVNLEISLHYLPFITSNEGKSQYTMPRSKFVVMRVSWASRLKWSFMKCVSLAHFLLYNVLRSLLNGYFDEFSMSIINMRCWDIANELSLYAWNLMISQIIVKWNFLLDLSFELLIFSLIAPNRLSCCNLLELILKISMRFIFTALFYSFNRF